MLFVTTKMLAVPGRNIEVSFKASLEKLGLDYVDLCLVHHPFKAADELPAVWAAFERIKESGKAKSIGVSNFTIKHLESIMNTAKILPVINQIEYHPYLQHGDLVGYCHQHNIMVSAYSTLVPITKAPNGPVDCILRDLAKKYSVTESDIVLKWCLDQGIAVITTSGKPLRLQTYRENISSFNLLPEEIKQICDAGNEKHFRVYYRSKQPLIPVHNMTTSDAIELDYFDAEDRD
jgi:diketogulonate reductase-like aldo/keto reductase